MAGAKQPTFPSDGETNFLGGQDASKAPDQVKPSFVYSAINTTFSRAVLGPRDGLIKFDLTFPEGGVSTGGKVAVPYKTIFEQGKFQAQTAYSIGDTFFQVIIVSGVVFMVDQSTLEVSVLEFPSGPRLNQYADRLNTSLAAKWLAIADYPLFPALIKGLTIRRADPAKYEIPISTRLAYTQNRVIAFNGSNEFTAGDPTGSLFTPDAPITFEEVFAPGAPYVNQAFQLPTDWQNNPVTCVTSLPLADSGTGVGPTIVATNSQVSAFDTQTPRQTWEQSNTFGKVIVLNAGICGQRAQVAVGSDLFFMDGDAQVRSLSTSRQEQGKWSKVGLSREVQNWTKFQDPDLLQFTAMTYFNNKIFATVNPYRVQARDLELNAVWDYAFGGMIALETDNISNISNESPPIWAGLWTGLRPMDFCINDSRLFIMAKEGTTNTLWEMREDLDYDVDVKTGLKRLIKSRIYSRNYSFQDPFIPKNMLNGNFPFNNVRGDFKFDLSYRPSNSANFLPWRSFTHEAPFQFCGIPWLCPNGLAPHNFNDLHMGSPTGNGCDPVTGQEYQYFNRVQLRFDIEGVDWELPFFKIEAKTIPQSDTQVECSKFKPASLCNDCNTDWAIPSFSECK